MKTRKTPLILIFLTTLLVAVLALPLPQTNVIHGQGSTATPTTEPIVLTPIVGRPSGAWVANAGKTITISLYMFDGENYRLVALVRASGVVAWDDKGKLTSVDSVKFVDLQTAAHQDHWYEIIDTEIQEDGLVSITVEEGVYSVLPPAISNEPTTRKLVEAMINADGDWEGQASFFITGFGAASFAALIYQDVRNYTVLKAMPPATKTTKPRATPTRTLKPKN
jgi:hypothetical protein